MLVVSDASPLRALAHLGLLGLLADQFDTVVIPTAVAAEIKRPKGAMMPVNVTDITNADIRAPQDGGVVKNRAIELDAGESEAIALALELHADRVLIDEMAGRAVCERMGLRPIGVLGVLLDAKSRGLVDAVVPLWTD